MQRRAGFVSGGYARRLELDHVLIPVTNLPAGAQELEARFGLASIEGGRHPGFGTANRIVPLGDCYLELVAVVDQAEAEQNPFGRRLAAAEPGLDRPLGWAVRTDRLDEEAARLGLAVSSGSRATPDGRTLRWRMAGLEEAVAEPFLPFLLQWEQGTELPGRARVEHPAGDVSLVGLELEGDQDRLDAWLGAGRLPVTLREGPPRVATIVLTATAGPIVLG